MTRVASHGVSLMGNELRPGQLCLMIADGATTLGLAFLKGEEVWMHLIFEEAQTDGRRPYQGYSIGPDHYNRYPEVFLLENPEIVPTFETLSHGHHHYQQSYSIFCIGYRKLLKVMDESNFRGRAFFIDLDDGSIVGVPPTTEVWAYFSWEVYLGKVEDGSRVLAFKGPQRVKAQA